MHISNRKKINQYTIMDELDEHLRQLSLIRRRLSYTDTNKNTSINENRIDLAKIAKNIKEKKFCGDYTETQQNLINHDEHFLSAKKAGPLVPPKPLKKSSNVPEIPQSSLVKQACEPLYAKRLPSLERLNYDRKVKQPLLFRKQISYSSGDASSSLGIKVRRKVTLDNPAILEQQLEALEHHKKQLEKRGKLNQNSSSKSLQLNAPKLSTSSLLTDASLTTQNILENSNLTYVNTVHKKANTCFVGSNPKLNIYENIISPENALSNVYSNVAYDNVEQLQVCGGESDVSVSQTLLAQKRPTPASNEKNILYFTHNGSIITEDDIPPPPSPVSSSYSELRRATEVFKTHEVSQKGVAIISNSDHINIAKPIVRYETPPDHTLSVASNDIRQMYINKPPYTNNDTFNNYNTGIQISTYESIYEPINPRPPSQLSTRSHNLMYPMCIKTVNDGTLPDSGDISKSNSSNLSSLSGVSAGISADSDSPIYPSNKSEGGGFLNTYTQNPKELEVKSLTNFLAKSLDPQQDLENYGICLKCNEIVVGENSGCTAMGQIYHIACFTCSQCLINLQGKPFYALDCKPYCEFDYLQTLEKCSVCMKPILERILRATGKPYHPQCFTCVVCKKSLDGIPFTVDATNQNYCIEDFHKKFAPRCCVCKEPIMPEPGEEETVRVVALDRSFHFECYKCEDCSLLLSSEAEGRGCYPLDDHVLCKSCNAKRVQMLTNRMTTTEL